MLLQTLPSQIHCRFAAYPFIHLFAFLRFYKFDYHHQMKPKENTVQSLLNFFGIDNAS